MLEYVVEIARTDTNQDRAMVIPLDDGIIVALADGAAGLGSRGGLAAHAVVCAAARPNVAYDLSSTLEKLDEDLNRRGGESTAVYVALTQSVTHGASVDD